jgi:hypothetical protein
MQSKSGCWDIGTGNMQDLNIGKPLLFFFIYSSTGQDALIAEQSTSSKKGTKQERSGVHHIRESRIPQVTGHESPSLVSQGDKTPKRVLFLAAQKLLQ